jgi:ATP-binding cassette subfamily F protein 3
MMLSVQGIAKSYGVETVLDEVSFVVNAGERVGLVGPNGCGKSTLLRIIAGEEQPDQGVVALPGAATLGYLRQGLTPTPGLPLIEAALAGYSAWAAARQEVHEIAEQMAQAGSEEIAALLAQYDRAAAAFEALGGYDIERQAEALLGQLGLGGLDPQTPVDQLSGGEQTRLLLAGVLLAAPDLLLLDEPTNHLDIAMLEWLESFLAGFRGAALIVSHDRVFLDRTVSRILALDGRSHTVREYTGTYSDYETAHAQEVERQWQSWKADRAEERRMREDIHRTKMQAMSVELTTTPGEPGVRRIARKVAKKAVSRGKKLDRFLSSEERVERPDRHWQMRLDFGEMPRGGQEVIALSGVGHRFNGSDWLFREVDALLAHGERIALLGPNGSGKSTLLRIITGEIAPEAGAVRIGANVRIGYMPQKQEALPAGATPLETVLGTATLSETDARNLLHYFLFAGDEVFTPVGKLSYGERARLLLARLVLGGANCLVLDEPVNHLDIPSRLRFEEALNAFPGAALIVTHDRAFIDCYATGIWALEDGCLRRYLDREEMRRTRAQA